MTTQDPRPIALCRVYRGTRAMVFQLLDSVTPGVKLVETVSFNVARDKEKRFLELVDGLIADSSKSAGIVAFNFHKSLPASDHSTEYLLYEVWRDGDALKKQWESDFLKVFEGKLISENLLVAPPELKFFLHSVAMLTENDHPNNTNSSCEET